MIKIEKHAIKGWVQLKVFALIISSKNILPTTSCLGVWDLLKSN
jgi:hypothetical protein